MKRVKRFLSVLLTLCMLMGMLPSTAFAVDHSMPFADVENTDWFYDAVEYVYDNGIMSGTGDTTFSPDIATTRSMIVTILHRMEGTPSANGEGFADVPAGQWYTNAISWASANGVVSGYGNGMFGPNDPITREQMAAILYRYVQYKEYDHAATGDVSAFADFSQTSDYAVEALNWATGEGLISGVGNNMLDPTGSATRAQAAMILMRFCEQVIPADTSEPETFTVTFEYNYGNKGVYETAEVNDGDTVDPPENPSRSGCSFNGWYIQATGGKKFDFDSEITSDITLYAKWSVKNSSNSGSGGSNSGNRNDVYTVVFYLNDGSGTVYDRAAVNKNEQISVPTPPARDGYRFTDWYTDSNCKVLYNFSDAVNQNINLYAGWERIAGEVMYAAPTETDIDTGEVEYNGQTYVEEYVNNQLIVSAKAGVPRESIQALLSPYHGIIAGLIETIDLYQITFESPKTLDEFNQIIVELEKSALVEDAYLNTVIDCSDTAIPYYPSDNWEMEDYGIEIWNEFYPNDNNWGVEAIHAPSAWGMLIDEYGSIAQVPRVHVGIIDTYIDIEHPDLYNLNSIYWYQTGFNTFRKDQTNTTAMEYAAEVTKWEDYKHIIHGTHVAGTIGADFNNGGVNGVALNPILYGVSVAEARGSIVYTNFGLATALSNLIEDSNCTVINFSMGYANYNESKAKKDGEKVGNVLKKYLDQGYDFVIVAAAGNDNKFEAEYANFFNSVTDSEVKNHILVVGNAQNQGGVPVANESQNYGARMDVMAPGTNILSTVSSNPNDLIDSKTGIREYIANDQYIRLTGTSMAAPHVSGLAALVWAANPNLTGADVKDIIVNTANIPVEKADAGGYSHNMVNAAYAVAEALGEPYLIRGSCGENLTWTLDTNGSLVIAGTGAMSWDEEKSFAPWYRYQDMIQSLSFESGITSIYESAFIECQAVKQVIIPETVTHIGYYAFGDMPNLKEIIIPASVDTIEKQALGYIAENRVEDFTIYGFANTAAEIYANENNFSFIDLASIPLIITGTVTDVNTGLALENVDVYVYDENGDGPHFTGKTSSDGIFSIVLDEAGTYNLTFMKDGYKDFELLAVEVNSSVTIGTIQLTALPVEPVLTPAISGTVVDADTGLALANVNVYVCDENDDDPRFTGETSSNGTFSITLEERGTYNLKFVKNGYEEYVLNNIVVTSGTTLVGTISLKPDSALQEPGDGTPENPYKIYTAEQLAELASRVNGGDTCDGEYFEVMDNINLSAYDSWPGIGSFDHRFNGNFDGNNFTISNIKFTNPAHSMHIGLFGFIHEAVIENIHLSNVQISLPTVSAAGGIAGGVWASNITNCSVSGNFDVSVSQSINLVMGGIVGIINGNSIISNCKNSANIDGGAGSQIGGIAGYAVATMNSTIQILNCSNSGEIHGGESVGDIVGYQYAYSGSQVIIQ